MTGLATARARNTDPSSSHLAARDVERSGKAPSQRAAVLAALRRAGPSTSAELAEYMQADRYMVARRLPELAEDRDAFRGPVVFCTVGRRRCVQWWPTVGDDA